MSAVPWTQIEDAIRTWIKNGSGLPDESVIWAQYGGPRPTDPWISINTTSLDQVGVDFSKRRTNPASNGHDGQELVTTTRGIRRGTLSIQCFAVSPSDGQSAISILTDVVAAAYIPSVRRALDAAGVGLSDFSPVRSIGAVINQTTFEPRAVVDVTFYATSAVDEFTTYIEHVEITPTVDGEVEPEIDVP